MTTLQQLTSVQASPEVPLNENSDTLSWGGLLGKRHAATSGLTWAFYGGLWGGTTVADGTVTLTNATTNYVVAARDTGAVTVSTATANWNNPALYMRLYQLTTAGSVVTAVQDHRAGPYGPFAPPVVRLLTLTDGGTIALDAGLMISVKARVTLGGNRTLANPTNLVDGARIVVRVAQDGTGNRTLAYGSKWKFPAGAPTLSTAASAVDLITADYDVTSDTLMARIDKALA